MNKIINEMPQTKPTVRAPQSTRGDEAFQIQTVENWLQCGKPGTHIA